MASSPGQSPADLARVRGEVEAALGGFIRRQRRDLAALSPELTACADAIADLLAGGKRLRAAFCYWGWRACGGADVPAIFAAAASLELLHASALVHDDLMDASDTRRGQPSVHRRFAAVHADGGWRGSADAFGAGSAILIGDLLMAWTDQLFTGSGVPAAGLRRGQPVLDAMRTELICGQYLDLLGTVDSALRVVRFKSAKYTVERPLQLGAALAAPQPAGDPATERACRGYGIP